VDEIGLFPLGIVLLPTERIPLHIFEPRYLELIGECLGERREFGLVLGDDDGTQTVGTYARVTEVLNRFEDGRLDVVVEGMERFAIAERSDGRSFQTAFVDRYDDILDPAPADDITRALGLYAKLAELTGSDVDAPDPAAPALSFELAARFEFAPPLKQELLEAQSERHRLARLCEMLELAAEVVARQHEIAALAATNGHAKPGGS
jgi:ATP-dependent Lon protease